MFRFPLTLSAALVSLPALADTLKLPANNFLSGEIQAIQNGVVSLSNPHSVSPLKIKLKDIERITFNPLPNLPVNAHQQVISLRNGDRLPSNLISLNAESLTVQTWYAGQLTVPRNQVGSLQLSAKPSEIVYSGTSQTDGWSESNGWNFQGNRIVSSGVGNIAREVDLPNEFILSFQLKWSNSPNFVLRIGGTHADFNRQKSDEYLVLFNNAGLQVQRHSPKSGNAYRPIVQLAEPPTNFPDRTLDVELRFNRRENEILLFINGEERGRYIDPQENLPVGNQLILESRASNHGTNQITKLEITEWNALNQSLRQNINPDHNQDSITTKDGDRYSGELIGFNAESSSLIIRSPLAPQPISIPLDKVAVLSLKKEEVATPKSKTTQVLKFAGGGVISTSDLTLADGLSKGTHPVLGPITIDRSALTEISPTPKPTAE